MAYVCPECDYEDDAPGVCPDCTVDLVEEKIEMGPGEAVPDEEIEAKDEEW